MLQSGLVLSVHLSLLLSFKSQWHFLQTPAVRFGFVELLQHPSTPWFTYFIHLSHSNTRLRQEVEAQNPAGPCKTGTCSAKVVSFTAWSEITTV